MVRAGEIRRHRLLRWAGLAALIVAASLVLAACDDDDDDNGDETAAATTAATTGGGAAETVDISETDFKLTPSDPTVKAGQVTFNVTNDGQTTHALEVEGQGVEEETEDIEPGGSAQLTVDLSKPGSYEMYCPIDGHKDQGMEGEITVQ